jgi:hypothetical protein
MTRRPIMVELKVRASRLPRIDRPASMRRRVLTSLQTQRRPPIWRVVCAEVVLGKTTYKLSVITGVGTPGPVEDDELFIDWELQGGASGAVLRLAQSSPAAPIFYPGGALENRVPYLTGRVERSCSQATSTLRGLGVSVVPSKIRLWYFIGGKVRGSFHLRISAWLSAKENPHALPW